MYIWYAEKTMIGVFRVTRKHKCLPTDSLDRIDGTHTCPTCSTTTVVLSGTTGVCAVVRLRLRSSGSSFVCVAAAPESLMREGHSPFYPYQPRQQSWPCWENDIEDSVAFVGFGVLFTKSPVSPPRSEGTSGGGGDKCSFKP